MDSDKRTPAPSTHSTSLRAGSAQDRFHRGDKFKVEAMSFAKLRLGIYYLRKSGFLVFLNNQINVY